MRTFLLELLVLVLGWTTSLLLRVGLSTPVVTIAGRLGREDQTLTSAGEAIEAVCAKHREAV